MHSIISLLAIKVYTYVNAVHCFAVGDCSPVFFPFIVHTHTRRPGQNGNGENHVKIYQGGMSLLAQGMMKSYFALTSDNQNWIMGKSLK